MTEPHLEESIFGDDLPMTRRERRQMQEKPKRGRRRLSMLLALLLVGGAAVLAFTFLKPIVSSILEPEDFPGPGSGSVEVVVKKGDSGRAIAQTLAESGVIKTTEAFLDAASAQPQKAASIQPGAYTLKKEMRAADALVLLTDSDNRRVPSVTIREGLWTSEVFALLSEATGTPIEEYEAAAQNPEALGLPPAAEGSVEGFLFPSTYEFQVDATAQQQLRRMVQETEQVIDELGIPQGEVRRTMIVASIIEGEVSGDADRGKVARVIENRLDGAGGTNGLLQMDSTIHYITQQRGEAGTSDEARESDSPYNTYRFEGLPPGPINNPGRASIEAAANPTPGDWAYFVTVNPSTGETRFAETYDQHQDNVAIFREWCSEHPDEC